MTFEAAVRRFVGAWVLLLALSLVAGAIVALLLHTVDARAHDAPATPARPEGWSYPFACCSNYDCRPVAETDVQERPEGYVVPSGEVIPMTDKRIRHSPDGYYHWCTVAGKADGRTLCLFVPPRAF